MGCGVEAGLEGQRRAVSEFSLGGVEFEAPAVWQEMWTAGWKSTAWK